MKARAYPERKADSSGGDEGGGVDRGVGDHEECRAQKNNGLKKNDGTGSCIHKPDLKTNLNKNV